MSGIVGIWNTDGGKADRVLLGRMTQFLRFRGPDAERVWVDEVSGAVGFGHTLLQTTVESAGERQPLTLDGRHSIVADARVDAQDELIAKLQAAGEAVKRGVTDAELLLRAYRVWGEDCVDHLLGDFAFAVWDGVRRRLFCARDHLGIKLLYYARIGRTFLFSNTLDCLREHPAVSSRLNDLAVADFLLFERNQDPATTTFADIQCVPPAHTLTCDASKTSLRRYFAMPVDEPVRFRRMADYPDRFLELLRVAVKDRVRTERVAVYMSGGLDSTSVAAVARPLCDLAAYAVVYDYAIPDEERHYSGLVGKALDIPVHYLAADDYRPFERWDEPEMYRPEPEHSPARAADVDLLTKMASHSRVAFYGEGPDNALYYEWRPYVKYLLERRQFGRLAMDVLSYVRMHRRLPLWTRISNRMRPSGQKWEAPSFPAWLNQEFSQRLGLEERWRDLQPANARLTHPYRPKGASSFRLAEWRTLFEQADPGVHGFPVETRHPYLDLRLLRFMLSVPALPWCAGKMILRRAMNGVLPEAVLRRAKAPLSRDPWARAAADLGELRRPSRLPAGLSEYLDVSRLPAMDPQGAAFWADARPYCFERWWMADVSRRQEMAAAV